MRLNGVLALLGVLLSIQEATASEIRGFIFDETGVPVAGVQVQASDGSQVISDREGVFRLRVTTGTVSLRLRNPGQKDIEIDRVASLEGEVTELIVQYRSAGEPQIDIEAPTTSQGETITTTVTAHLKGLVVDAEKGQPVSGARVFVRGLKAETKSDQAGRFELALWAGPRHLAVLHADFETVTASITLKPEPQENEITIRMEPRSAAMAEMVVTIPKLEGGTVFLLEERRDSTNVSDVLGAEQMAKSGDSDAAGALKRVTGITVVNGRFVYVRGLGERYSSTLLDGSTLPSPDPERRVVPLDLFPASTLGSILVQKTYSPDLQGEFGGGAVLLRTRDIPSTFEATFSLGTGFRTRSTFRSGPSYSGSSTDFLGFDGGTRSLPQDVERSLESSRVQAKTVTGSGFTPEELEALGESLDLDFGLKGRTVNPNLGVSADVGGPFELFGLKSGARFGMTYDNSWFLKRRRRKTLVADLSVKSDQTLTELHNNVHLGGLANWVVELSESHRIRSTTFLGRISENVARQSEGLLGGENVVASNRLRWVEQMLLTEQIQGQHGLLGSEGPQLHWRYMFSLADRSEPNLRDIFYIRDGQTLRLDTNDNKNQRFHSDLIDFNHDVGMDLAWPITLFYDVESTLKGGLALVMKSREVDTRRFTYFGNLPSPSDRQSADDIFNPDTIGPGADQLRLDEITLDNDAYRADQLLWSAYLMADVGITSSLRVMAGARVERSSQQVETFLPPLGIQETPNAEASLSTFDLLPAATASWGFYDDMLLRVAFSRTLARPNFRELSPAVFRDPAGTLEFQGNPDLKRTILTNGDIRWEWYPRKGESVSVAGFVKSFQDPVEIRLSAGAVDREIPINVPSALNFGAEIEFRKELSELAEWLADFYVSGNLTLVRSRVSLESLDPELRGILSTLDRPLSGQSPFVINAQLGYDNVELGLSVAALYNVFGRRITALGARGLPDRYQQVAHRLDLVASQKLGRFKVSLKAQNLIDPALEQKQGDVVVETFRQGRTFSASLGVDLH